MGNLVIGISWEYFIGLMGTLICIAYYANGRFSRLETSVDWLTEAVRDVMVRLENLSARAFHPGSPVTLTYTGRRLLDQSGLRLFIETHRGTLLRGLRKEGRLDSYRIQHEAFEFFATFKFDSAFERHLNQFAFDNGISVHLLRRLGAICLRDLAVKAE